MPAVNVTNRPNNYNDKNNLTQSKEKQMVKVNRFSCLFSLSLSLSVSYLFAMPAAMSNGHALSRPA